MGYVYGMFIEIGGVPARHGATPIAGWLISGNIPSFEMDDDWGYPHDYGNPHILMLEKS